MHTQLHRIIADMADHRGDAPAVTHGDTTLSYAELWRDVTAFAAGLQRLGLQRGERVGIFLDKRIETVVSVFGTSAAGGVFVPINPVLRPKQVAYILADCGVRVLVTTRERHALLREELEQCDSVEHVIVLGEAPDAGLHGWESCLDAGEPSELAVIDVDMAAILYTSGSTGKPKGVVLSHRNLLVGGASVSQYLGNHEHDCILAALPLELRRRVQPAHHRLHRRRARRARQLPAAGRRRPPVREHARHRAHLRAAAVDPAGSSQEWPAEATRSLRYFANTGGRMPRATLARLRAIFPDAKPYPDVRPDRGVPLDLPRSRRGRPASRLDRQGDPERRDPRRPRGRVALRSRARRASWSTAARSWPWATGTIPERTAERFRPAPGREAGICSTEIAVWSGDTVVKDEEGFLYFVSRKDEMIKTSGYRVSPTEIEEVAYSTGLVRDAVALGVDDPRVGQHIVLAVSPRTATSSLPERLLAELQAAVAAVHGPEGHRRAPGPAAVAERQVRPQPAAAGADRPMTAAAVATLAPDALRRRRRDPARPARGAGRRNPVLRV